MPILRYTFTHLIWLVRAIVMGMGFTWLPIEAYEGLKNVDVTISYCLYLLVSLAVGLAVFVIDGYFVGGFLKNKVVISSNSFDTRAACKTLIDSERRKNTQASSDVGARQLVRF